ncbi:hypothetical protein H6F61_13490 [Cyanobacteria bacterium FACHB-472]|nr:hypothetical protein [Cyanobacteria bacterium FACHB-472]
MSLVPEAVTVRSPHPTIKSVGLTISIAGSLPNAIALPHASISTPAERICNLIKARVTRLL